MKSGEDTMENLDVSKKELEIIKMGLKYSGSEANIYEATNKSLYKIFESLSKKELENKKKKIELLIKKQIPFFRNPIRTLLCEGKFIGYELEYDLNDIIWWNVCMPKEEKIMPEPGTLFAKKEEQVNEAEMKENKVEPTEEKPFENIETSYPKFCPSCGTPTSGGNFCGNCGNKLK